MSAPTPIVLILQADSFSAESLRRHVQAVRPGANCVLVTTATCAERVLTSHEVNLFITTLEGTGGDVIDLLLLCKHRERSARQTLVTAHRHGARMLVSLRSLAVSGVFDVAGEAPERIEHAIRIIDGGGLYWSPTIWERFAQQDCRIVLHQLAPSEQLGLAIIGNGCGDEVAASCLNMTRFTMRRLRRDLHTKLGVHDRHGLIRCAARLGYTGFGSGGVVAFGLAIIVMEYLTRCKRPVSLPPELLSLCRIAPDGIIVPKRVRVR